VINRALNSSAYNTVEINKRKFGFKDGFFSDLLFFNVFLPVYLRVHGGRTAILLVPNNVSKFLFIPFRNTIYFIHDLIPLDRNCGYRGLRRFIYLLKMRQVKSALAILTTTQFVKRQIVDLTGTSKRIQPVNGFINNSLRSQFADWKRDCKLPSEFILAVGSGEYRKNVESILEVYSYDNKVKQLPQLVLYGKSWNDVGHKKIIERARLLNIDDRIIIAGTVSDEELSYLYSHCSVFIYPSIAEGFGLPPIEALACGASVVVSDSPVFRETLGTMARYVDTKNVFEFHCEILSCLRQSSKVSATLLDKYSEHAARLSISRAISDIVDECQILEIL